VVRASLRGHEQRVVRTEVAATDPDLLASPVAGDVRRDVLHQSSMHRQDRVRVDPVSQRKRCLHGVGVGHDLAGVAPTGVAELGFCDGTG
jgi:hypothetical protein